MKYCMTIINREEYVFDKHKVIEKSLEKLGSNQFYLFHEQRVIQQTLEKQWVVCIILLNSKFGDDENNMCCVLQDELMEQGVPKDSIVDSAIEIGKDNTIFIEIPIDR